MREHPAVMLLHKAIDLLMKDFNYCEDVAKVAHPRCKICGDIAGFSVLPTKAAVASLYCHEHLARNIADLHLRGAGDQFQVSVL